ncbi:MAG TPA: asparagine synthase (glutamine-hydrolyzing) [Candidatus Didemnitutus sp.]|nr:asparagine synthase (glutamine-hydrolyzing) [Candidatus Didemnitutus sp.]
MCGILFTNRPEVERDDFLAALELMRHRGPDAPPGYAEIGRAKLGHQRLSIVDLNPRSNQPFVSRDGRFVIVFNGEIYNYRELAREHGVELRTSSDTELLVELYARHREKMLPWLFGMFAFVIVDRTTGALFWARDRLGVKPLYVSECADGVVIASELTAVEHLIPGATVDEFALRQYRKMRGFFNGRTIFQEIRMFPAGHYSSEGKVRRYWDLPSDEQAPPSDEELEALVRSAVDYRCIADVPVGSYLSGGLDSSIVAALSNRTHTWVVGTAEDNEFSWAEQVARHLGTVHHAITVSPEQFLESARRMIVERNEPLAVPNEVLLAEMTRAVKTENTVVLSGEGADELFGGYDRIFRWAAGAPTWDWNEFAQRYCYGSQDDMAVVEDAVAPYLSRGSPLAIVSAFFQIAHLHGLLRRLDNSTMRCSVEGRVPFVDHRLVERLAGVSLDYKMANGVVKAPLKRIFARLLPAAVINRPKVGFPVPIDRLLPEDVPGATPMDRWFNFNLAELGLESVALNECRQ